MLIISNIYNCIHKYLINKRIFSFIDEKCEKKVTFGFILSVKQKKDNPRVILF